MDNEEVVFLVNGPMVGRRKIIEKGVTEVTFDELESGDYIRTDKFQGGEPVFEYRA